MFPAMTAHPAPTTRDSTPPAAEAASHPYAPWALSSHDLAWGIAVAVLSVGMFVVTPTLIALRMTGVWELALGWVFLPAGLCVVAVFLHGAWELGRSLLRG